jgi:uncharacterized protein (DUF1697 family)
MPTFIALLRGINVGGHNKIPMPELRSLCNHFGWDDVQSYIQSGNLVINSESAATDLEAELENAIERRFNLAILVIVRAAADWQDYIASNPFPDASQREPNLVMLALSKSIPKHDALPGLLERAVNGERIAQKGDALWVHFAAGVGKSKLTPVLFDRLVGSPVTMRNWHTVLKLNELVEDRLK